MQMRERARRLKRVVYRPALTLAQKAQLSSYLIADLESSAYMSIQLKWQMLGRALRLPPKIITVSNPTGPSWIDKCWFDELRR